MKTVLFIILFLFIVCCDDSNEYELCELERVANFQLYCYDNVLQAEDLESGDNRILPVYDDNMNEIYCNCEDEYIDNSRTVLNN